jgi:hypothetical protein
MQAVVSGVEAGTVPLASLPHDERVALRAALRPGNDYPGTSIVVPAGSAPPRMRISRTG